MRIAHALFALLLCAADTALAQEAAPPDPRLRLVPYQADQVVDLTGHIGYQMMIEFDPRERIENVSIGDSLGWQVTPNRAATLLFLKPVAPHAATNMTVVTTQRRYAFALRTREADSPDDPSITYSLRFIYPDEPRSAASAPDPAAFSFDYTFSGAEALTPERVFDDGRFTYFRMPEHAELPAIFVLDRHGAEEVVNSQLRNGYIVVDQVADAFVLRHGRDRTIVRSGSAEVAEPDSRLRRWRFGRDGPR